MEAAFWESRMVDIVDMDLEDYVAELELRVGERPSSEPRPVAPQPG